MMHADGAARHNPQKLDVCTILTLERTCTRLHALLGAEDAEPWQALLERAHSNTTPPRMQAGVQQRLHTFTNQRRFKSACLLRYDVQQRVCLPHTLAHAQPTAISGATVTRYNDYSSSAASL